MNRAPATMIDLATAALCVDLDCETIFDTIERTSCPHCGSAYVLLGRIMNAKVRELRVRRSFAVTRKEVTG